MRHKISHSAAQFGVDRVVGAGVVVVVVVVVVVDGTVVVGDVVVVVSAVVGGVGVVVVSGVVVVVVVVVGVVGSKTVVGGVDVGNGGRVVDVNELFPDPNRNSKLDEKKKAKKKEKWLPAEGAVAEGSARRSSSSASS